MIEVDKKEIAQLFLIAVLFILLLIGGKFGIAAVIITIIGAYLKLINWKHLFYVGIALTPIKRLAVTSIGFHLNASQLFLITGIIAAFFDKNNKLKWKSDKFDFRLFVFLFVLVISSFQSRFIPIDPVVILGALRNYPWIKSLSRIVLMGVLVGVALFVRAYVSSDKKRFEALMKGLLLFGTVHALIGLFGFVIYAFGVNTSLVVQHGDDPQRIMSFESEPLFFGNYLLTILPVAVLFCFKKQNIIDRRFAIPAALIILSGSVLTFSRGVWAGILAAFVFLIIINARLLFKESLTTKKAIVIILLSLCVLIGVVFLINLATDRSFYQNFIEPVIGAINPNHGKFWSTRLRLMTIGLGLSAFLQHPFLGIGYENFSFHAGNIFINSLSEHILNYPDINSFPFKLLIETGIIGFTIITFLVFKSFIDLLRSVRKTKDVTAKVVIEGYCGVIIGIIVQLFFFSNIFSIYLWIMLGVVLGIVNEKV